jgi:PHD/YefM family antitoxin component YafN of YafNO toxin-antitoxin module
LTWFAKEGEMVLVAAQEIKRRGVAAVEGLISKGPVHVVKNNKASFVMLSEKDYETLLSDLAEARLAASEADLKAGRVKRGSAKQLMAEISKGL